MWFNKLVDIGSMEGQYLIKFQSKKKVVKCCKEFLTDEVKKVFNISGNVYLKYFNDDFKEWVDVDNENELPERAKLSVALSLNG